MRMRDWRADVGSSDVPNGKVALLLVNAGQQLTGDALGTVRPDIVQFHGSETPEWLAVVKRLAPAEIWKAIGLKDAETLERMQKFYGIADRILFDAPAAALPGGTGTRFRSEEHTSELQSLMRNSYAVFCLKKKKTTDLQTA